MNISREFIYAVTPAAKAQYVSALVRHQSLLEQYGITSVADVCHFIAQCAVETQGFTRLDENLYYTSVARLRAVWPSRFTSNAKAQPYVRNPQKLANFVYGGRLGNTGPNDGWAYRGSGPPHLTGKANYQMVQDNSGIDCVDQPELIREFPEGLEAACVFWKVNKLSRYVGDVKALTKRWQGGSGGLRDRQTYTKRALEAATTQTLANPAPAKLPETKLLRNGSKGAAVKTLQTLLEMRGYELGNIDGDFGDATERALREFQAAHELIADGVAGPLTMTALQAAPAPAKVPTTVKQPSGLQRFLEWLLSLLTRS